MHDEHPKESCRPSAFISGRFTATRWWSAGFTLRDPSTLRSFDSGSLTDVAVCEFSFNLSLATGPRSSMVHLSYIEEEVACACFQKPENHIRFRSIKSITAMPRSELFSPREGEIVSYIPGRHDSYAEDSQLPNPVAIILPNRFKPESRRQEKGTVACLIVCHAPQSIFKACIADFSSLCRYCSATRKQLTHTTTSLVIGLAISGPLSQIMTLTLSLGRLRLLLQLYLSRRSAVSGSPTTSGESSWGYLKCAA